MKTAILTLFLTIIMLMLFSNVNCRDPHDFEPNPDSLLDPPPAPALLSPDNEYVYMAAANPFFIYVDFAWSEVADAEEYSLELTIDTFAPVYYPTTSPQWTILLMDSYRLCDYSWRVRAYSAAWKFYTDWSETRYFEARWQPDGPELFYPANYQNFTFNSLPEVVDLEWRSIADENYYEILVGRASDTLLRTYVSDTFSVFLAETTGTFWWQIKAGNIKWQLESRWSSKWYFIINVR
jgi:hypothetical protein